MSTQPPLPPIPQGPGQMRPLPQPPGAPGGGPPPQPGQPGESPTLDEAGGDAALQPSFWQQPFVQNVLPFLTSLLLHAALITIGLLTAKVITKVYEVVHKDQIIVPDAQIVEGAEVGGIPHPGLGGDPNRDAAQDKFPDVPPNTDGWADKPSKDLTAALQGGGSGDAANQDSLIGVGPGGGSFGKGTGIGTGTGVGTGSGTGDGSGALAPFGVPGGGGGIGPRSTFVGVSGNAKQVIFACDASGSMMQKFDPLRVELRKAVEGLKPPQSFNVIFFQETAAVSIENAKQLLFASPENKRKAAEFLDKTSPRGSTDPIPALKMAFQMQPQLIFLLTDGDFPNNDEVLAEIRKLNGSKGCKINTIAFMDRGESYEKVLKQIATENGGLFRFVSGDELGK